MKKKKIKYTFKIIEDEDFPDMMPNQENPYSCMSDEARLEYLVENFSRLLNAKRIKDKKD